MKFKIKEIKSHYVSKGNLPIQTYVPMVKKNWYSPWLVIVSGECGITLKLSNKTYTKYGSCSRTYAHELIEKYKDTHVLEIREYDNFKCIILKIKNNTII